MAYLTPNAAPSRQTCRALFIPDEPDWIALVTGALMPLSEAYNFTQYGTSTPQQTSDVFFGMVNDFIANRRDCKMIGEIVLWGGNYSPDGLWLECNGASILRSDYPELFGVIGTLYGSVDGSHFNIPDLRGTVPASADTLNPVGTQYGEATHVLTEAEMPSHSHTGIPEFLDTAAGLEPLLASELIPLISANTGYAGGGAAHNNIQPTLSVMYFIVAG